MIEDFLAEISACVHVHFVLEDWVFLNNVFHYLAWNPQLVVRLQLLEIHRDDGWNAQNG